MKFIVSLAALAGLASGLPSSPLSHPKRINGNTLVGRQDGKQYAPHTIDMPIDHFPQNPRYNPHTNATFKQRYFFDNSYYKPGGPVFLYIGGETSGESRFSNLQTGIIQILMQQFNGLGVILENRYYGGSYPYNTTTTDQLAYLTTEQTIADNRYFALHAKFPGVSGNLNSPNTPWILYGGSLAGGQTAFSVADHGDVLFGGIAASAPIAPKLTYPEWYHPIQLYAPQDCVASINDIIDKFDGLVRSNNNAAVQKFKEAFGLGALKDNRDFAQIIGWPIGGPLNYDTNTWQELNWKNLPGAQDFWYFCRNVTNLSPPANNTAVDKQFANYTNGQPWTNLGNYAAYVKRVVLPFCPSGDFDNTSCFGTQNQSYWADTTNSVTRSYLYQTCTELGVYQAAPRTGPTLISRVLQANYTQQWCQWAFPKGKYNSVSRNGPDFKYYFKYGGYGFNATRVALVDGSSDVWRDVGFHSTSAPSPRPYSDLRPQYLIEGSGHHWDSYGILNLPDTYQYVREGQYWEIRVITRWLQGFDSWRKANSGVSS